MPYQIHILTIGKFFNYSFAVSNWSCRWIFRGVSDHGSKIGKKTFLGKLPKVLYIASSISEISDYYHIFDQMPYLVRKRSEIYTQVRNFWKNLNKMSCNPSRVRIIWISGIPKQNSDYITKLLNFLTEYGTLVRIKYLNK